MAGWAHMQIPPLRCGMTAFVGSFAVILHQNDGMPFDLTDTAHMLRALELARATLGLASPNPQVGCVIAHDNEIVGEGSHRFDLYDHAEIGAMKQAGERARGATAYVTLEPCSHHGRTGPCANALLDAGVARVVAATLDPNPLVAGKGMAILERGGVVVEHGLLEREARRMNDAFARHILTGLPLVTLKSALSVDGMLAPLPVQRTANAPFWLTGTAAREEVHRFRHASDCILTGIGTVLADDPVMTDRSNLQRRRRLLRVVLDTQCRLPLSSRLVESVNEDLVVFCARSAPNDRQRALRQRGVTVEAMPVLSPAQRGEDGRQGAIHHQRQFGRRHASDREWRGCPDQHGRRGKRTRCRAEQPRPR